MTPVTLDLVAHRWAPFIETPFGFEGLDFSMATIAMQVRLRRDATGDPLIDLEDATAGVEGVSVQVITTEGVPTSFLTVQINQATIDDLPFDEPDESPVFRYDLVITGGGLPKTRWFEGTFTVSAGVTQ